MYVTASYRTTSEILLNTGTCESSLGTSQRRHALSTKVYYHAEQTKTYVYIKVVKPLCTSEITAHLRSICTPDDNNAIAWPNGFHFFIQRSFYSIGFILHSPAFDFLPGVYEHLDHEFNTVTVYHTSTQHTVILPIAGQKQSMTLTTKFQLYVWSPNY